jgi:hypothetical protein
MDLGITYLCYYLLFYFLLSYLMSDMYLSLGTL